MKLLGIYAIDEGAQPAEVTFIFKMGRASPYSLAERFRRDTPAAEVAQRLRGLAARIEMADARDSTPTATSLLREITGARRRLGPPQYLHEWRMHPEDVMELERETPDMLDKDALLVGHRRFDGVRIIPDSDAPRLPRKS